MHNAPTPERPDPLETEQTKALLESMSRAGTRAFRILLISGGLVIIGLIAAVIYLLVAQANANHSSQVATQQAAIAAKKVAAEAVATDDHRWCATMALLTSTRIQPPADPAANPSRVQDYKLYQNFLTLKKEFKCA